MFADKDLFYFSSFIFKKLSFIVEGNPLEKVVLLRMN